ncbi:DarT ssDNA thymidine ADP-ribosyltransferase family protein [Viridibacillus arvi]|uniref:DarT ssDNA thymidine ADP-ribosyltransferase family protein n=1 Tax=Viridibacillus arvi TaxID=263475 RepID=UPI003CFE8442
MGIEDVRERKLLYHLTKLENLESIIENGLLSRRKIFKKGYSFTDVADDEILCGREEFGLDSYVPFHFHPYSAFDVAVKSKYDTHEFIYICIQRNFARNKDFLILPQHPLSTQGCELLDYDEGFSRIDWGTMSKKGLNDSYARQVKMAECLSAKKVLVEDFHCIAVENNKTKKAVESMLKDYDIKKKPPFVDIQKWF